MVNFSQIKPYRVHCLGPRGEFWVYLGDRGQFNLRQRRRCKKALRSVPSYESMRLFEGLDKYPRTKFSSDQDALFLVLSGVVRP